VETLPRPWKRIFTVVPKFLSSKISGLKSEDNPWTQTLRDKLDPDTVNGKLVGDRTSKTNQ
jgi:hypothetical protein